MLPAERDEEFTGGGEGCGHAGDLRHRLGHLAERQFHLRQCEDPARVGVQIHFFVPQLQMRGGQPECRVARSVCPVR